MPRTGLSAADLREKAIAAALARMRRIGFDKVRLSDVARDIGVSHAALYAHFTDKAALLDAVTERWLGEIAVTAAVVAEAGGGPDERAVEWLVALYRMKRTRALDDPEPHRAFDMASALAKPFVAAHLDRLLSQLAGLLKAAEPAIDDAEAARRARLVYRATTAFHHPSLVAQTAADDLEPELRALSALLLRGLRASPRG